MKCQLIILTLTLAVVLSAPTKEENPLRSVEDESDEDPWSSIESEEIKTGSKGKNVVSDIKNLVADKFSFKGTSSKYGYINLENEIDLQYNFDEIEPTTAIDPIESNEIPVEKQVNDIKNESNKSGKKLGEEINLIEYSIELNKYLQELRTKTKGIIEYIKNYFNDFNQLSKIITGPDDKSKKYYQDIFSRNYNTLIGKKNDLEKDYKLILTLTSDKLNNDNEIKPDLLYKINRYLTSASNDFKNQFAWIIDFKQELDNLLYKKQKLINLNQIISGHINMLTHYYSEKIPDAFGIQWIQKALMSTEKLIESTYFKASHASIDSYASTSDTKNDDKEKSVVSAIPDPINLKEDAVENYEQDDQERFNEYVKKLDRLYSN